MQTQLMSPPRNRLETHSRISTLNGYPPPHRLPHLTMDIIIDLQWSILHIQPERQLDNAPLRVFPVQHPIEKRHVALTRHAILKLNR